MATSVLNLDTLIERPSVVIDGVSYPLRATDDFAIVEFKRHVKEASRFADLVNQESCTPEEEAESEALADRYCRRILKAPAAVHDRLSGSHRLQIITVFAQLLGLRGRTAGAKATPPAETTTGTGARSSPGSPASTEGIH
jgi:hypothetical protein